MAILKKREKVTFSDDPDKETKRPRLDSIVAQDDDHDDTDAVAEVQKVPRAKEIHPNLSQAPRDFLSMISTKIEVYGTYVWDVNNCGLYVRGLPVVVL